MFIIFTPINNVSALEKNNESSTFEYELNGN